MKHRLAFSLLATFLILAGTTTLVSAWPDQPPDKVLISGPGLTGQVQVNQAQDRAIFQLGHLEDWQSAATAPAQLTNGFQIVRFFDGGGFDFARLTYYPGPVSGRGRLYFEDGPMLEGDHTPYHQKWLNPTTEGEKELVGLLTRLGANLNPAEPAAAPPKVESDQPMNPASRELLPDTVTSVVPVIGALLLGAIGGFAASEIARRWRRRTP